MLVKSFLYVGKNNTIMKLKVYKQKTHSLVIKKRIYEIRLSIYSCSTCTLAAFLVEDHLFLLIDSKSTERPLSFLNRLGRPIFNKILEIPDF